MKRASWGSRRGVRLATCGLVGALGVLLATGCHGRSKTRSEDGSMPKLAGGGHVSVVDLRMGAPESTAEGGFFPLPAKRTFVGLIRGLERIAEDDSSGGVFVRLGEAHFGFAQAAEIGRELGKLRKAGTKVTCHTHEIDNATSWLLQEGCSKIWVSPAGGVSTVGIGAQMAYLKGALDKLGIHADMLAMGKYKSGGEPLTREGPSEPSAQNLTDTLRQLRGAWLDGVRGSRAGEREGLLSALENGPWPPPQAREQGIVDAVGFEDEALEEAKKEAGVDDTKTVFGSDAVEGGGVGIADIVRILSGADERTGGRPHIAVVPMVGSITMNGEGPFSGGGITARAMTRTIERLREDDSVKAVVVRMDSPGGSPLASDLIWHELMLTRDKKPVVVSVGSMAASGGYYIACGATKVVAERSSIVGSIGVFGGKIVVEDGLQKVGINTYTFPASPEPGAAERSAYLSPLVSWDDGTRDKVRAQMQQVYDLFIERVATGRDMKPDAVRSTAEGAIFTATVGKERGLVDELGGLSHGLAVARKLAKLDDDAPVLVEGPADSILEALVLGDEHGAVEVEAALSRFQAKQARYLKVWPASLRPFAAALSPLIAGETVVAALPYAVEIR